MPPAGNAGLPAPVPGSGVANTPVTNAKASQRPVQVTVSITLAVTGSMVWMSGLAMVWLFVVLLRRNLDYDQPGESPLYYMVERFHLKLLEGLAWPLFGFPLAAVVLAFFLLLRRSWPRIAFSAWGGVSLLVTVVMLRANLTLLLPGIVYIAFTCLILWTPSVSRWYARDSGGPGPTHWGGR